MGLTRFGALRGFRRMKPFTGRLPAPKSLEEENGLVDKWTKLVGPARAREAADIWRVTVAARTLPELLAEAWAKKRGLNYRTQVDLMYAVPDLVLMGQLLVPPDRADFEGEMGALVIRVQGDYWHQRESAKARDPLQKDRLMKGTVYGQKVVAVIDAWESKIYQSEDVFDAALRGEELGQ